MSYACVYTYIRLCLTHVCIPIYDCVLRMCVYLYTTVSYACVYIRGASQDGLVSLRLSDSQIEYVYNNYYSLLDDNQVIDISGLTKTLSTNEHTESMYMCKVKGGENCITVPNDSLFTVLCSNINVLYYTDGKLRPSHNDYDALLAEQSIDRTSYSLYDIHRFMCCTPMKDEFLIVDHKFLVVDFSPPEVITLLSYACLSSKLINVRMVLRCLDDGTFFLYRYDEVCSISSQLVQSRASLLSHIVYTLSKRNMWSYEVRCNYIKYIIVCFY